MRSWFPVKLPKSIYRIKTNGAKQSTIPDYQCPDHPEFTANTFYDEDSGNWCINTPSPVLPVAMILQNGDIVPTIWEL